MVGHLDSIIFEGPQQTKFILLCWVLFCPILSCPWSYSFCSTLQEQEGRFGISHGQVRARSPLLCVISWPSGSAPQQLVLYQASATSDTHAALSWQPEHTAPSRCYLLSPLMRASQRWLPSSADRKYPEVLDLKLPGLWVLLVHVSVPHPSAPLLSQLFIEHLSLSACPFYLGRLHLIVLWSQQALCLSSGLSSKTASTQLDNKLIMTNVVFQYWETGTTLLPVVNWSHLLLQHKEGFAMVSAEKRKSQPVLEHLPFIECWNSLSNPVPLFVKVHLLTTIKEC